MSASDRPLLTSINERDVQLATVQLIQTAPTLRRWAIKQLLDEEVPTEFLGVSRSITDYYGETDIEIRVQTDNGDRHFILCECKVDASLHGDQVDRYYKRGERYLEEGLCDAFTVGLIAPEAYISDSIHKSFGSVLTYEDLGDKVAATSHASRPFFENVYDLAINNETTTDKSSLVQRLETTVRERFDEFTAVGGTQDAEAVLNIDSSASRLRIYS